MAPTQGDDLVDELLAASGALVGVTVRSVAAAPIDVTLAQHRLLVLLAGGPQSIKTIADGLGVNPSNASRHCDRLQRLGLLVRRRSADDGRVVVVELSPAGHRVLAAVAERRRQELASVAAQVPSADRAALAAALRAFNDAARAARLGGSTGPSGL